MENKVRMLAQAHNIFPAHPLTPTETFDWRTGRYQRSTMPSPDWTMTEQDRFIAEAMKRDESRLRSFIRKRVLDSGDAEDVLQDVFYELIQAYRLMKPAEQMTAWLFRVARNRITDLFRRQKAVSLSDSVADDEEGQTFEDLLPSLDAGPDAIYARNVLLDALEEAIDELPANQREVFIAHEILGRSFRELSEETGTSVNTLLSRKRYAVLYLRERLQEIHEGLGK
jgi:RNA polymerase sigma factor (sigma-70 family)